MRKILLSLFLSVLIWSACKKSESPPDKVIDQPVFSIQGSTDSLLSLTAGVDGKYLFTRSNIEKDSFLTMTGAFADEECPTSECPGSLRFEFTKLGRLIEPGATFGPDVSWEYKSPDDTLPGLERVAIQWVNAQGSVFRSDFMSQLQPSPDSAIFRIIQSESWELNERGETTWKMDVEFSCLLFNIPLGDQLKITGNGVIGVAYQ